MHRLQSAVQKSLEEVVAGLALRGLVLHGGLLFQMSDTVHATQRGATVSDLLKALYEKKAWFDGKWSLDDSRRPEYRTTSELLGRAIAEIERLEAEKTALANKACAYDLSRAYLRQRKEEDST